jgi:glycyl-tRNA synthetase beta chain
VSFYLLEVGTEELPASFVSAAASFLEEAAKEFSKQHDLDCQISAGATARRLFLYIGELPEKLADKSEDIQGPPADTAYDENGTLSQIGKKFAAAKGLDEASLKTVTTPKGKFLAGTKMIVGEDMRPAVAALAERIITGLSVNRTMRTGNSDFRFTRPVKYILSLFNGGILKLNIADIGKIPFTDTTVGHRFLAPEQIRVTDLASYSKALKRAYVIVDIPSRRKEIAAQINNITKDDFIVDLDDKLLDTTTNLVEYPTAVLGKFDERFLELPEQVLKTSMIYHQKFFPVYSNKGNEKKLLPKFIAVSNMRPNNFGPMRHGYERVLHARLNDALFFYNKDKLIPLEQRTEELKKVVHQEQLGTVYDKVERLINISAYLAETFSPDALTRVREAAYLAKADLMCEMVYEFPELQGFMGCIYATIQGKDAEIATAIEEHYLPRFAGDKLPSTILGRILAIADKIDNIASIFSIGFIPTGNEDPYSLRRSAIGLINIVEKAEWHISLGKLSTYALSLCKKEDAKLNENILEFILQRQRGLLQQAGISGDLFNVAAFTQDDLINIKSRACALSKVKETENFLSVLTSYKRINNILKKSPAGFLEVNPTLFNSPYENAIYELYLKADRTVGGHAIALRWEDAINGLMPFAEPLDLFFKNVMVMDKDEAVKLNRLSLLNKLKTLFNTVGDLSFL